MNTTLCRLHREQHHLVRDHIAELNPGRNEVPVVCDDRGVDVDAVMVEVTTGRIDIRIREIEPQVTQRYGLPIGGPDSGCHAGDEKMRSPLVSRVSQLPSPFI